MEWIQGLGLEALYIALGILAGLTLLDDAVADLVSRIPFAGRILAPLARRLSGRFREWIGERVPSAADRIVRETEAETAGAPGAVKLKLATAALQNAEPGLIEPEARAAVQSAVDRAKALPSLEDRRMIELESILTASASAPAGAVAGDARGPVE